MDFRQLRYFVTLFEEGSVTRAARRLGVVQSALSMQIRKLENEFQVQLFERTSRGVDPTPIGENLYRRAVDILDDMRGTATFLRDSSGHVIGDIAIGMMPSLSISVLAPTLLEFCKEYPAVKLRVLESYSDYLIEHLLKGALDFVVVNDDGDIRDVETIKLCTDNLVLVTQPRKGDASTTIRAADLRDMKIVLPSIRQGMRRTLDQYLTSSKIDLSPSIELDSLNAVLELVGRSDYASIFPSLAVKHAIASKQVRALRIIEPELLHSLVVAYNAHHPPGLAGREFIARLGSKITEMLDTR